MPLRGRGRVPVQVNADALIDKILARYSGEFTTFRELLQNLDDAGSSAVEIHFDSEGKRNIYPLTLHNLKSTNVTQWTFRNNGKLFRPEDWARLGRIAEGNPDPSKVGGFGVGFYSLFSVTESPSVVSGGLELEFSKDLNQLYYAIHSNEDRGPWTTFKIPLREPSLMPPLLEFMQFLASSITFMVHLRDVVVVFDHHPVGKIRKSWDPGQPIAIPTELQRSSPENTMTVQAVQLCPIMIEAAIVLPLDEDTPSKISSGKLEGLLDSDHMRMYEFSAEVDVDVDEKLRKELFRCMKKNPPSRLKYSLIYTGKDEYDQSCILDERKRNHYRDFPSILQGLLADLNGSTHTRIFIGHATAQTTGIGGHMASQFIPTVEREFIDLVDKNVSTWNRELLYVGGFLCRAVYELELSGIQRSWEEAAAGNPPHPPPTVQDQLQKRFLHVLEFFTFHHSTPSPKVSQWLANSFYGCSNLPLKLLSSVGVRGAPNVRAFDPMFAKFLKSLPMLSEYVTRHGAHSIAALPGQHKISPITLSDVLQNLKKCVLENDELVACLQWWITAKQDNRAFNTTDLLNAASFRCTGGTMHPLSSIRYFVDPKGLGLHIPSDEPLPPTLIPLAISKHFVREELTDFGWNELTVDLWLEHAMHSDATLSDSRYDFTQSVDWAGRILAILFQVWPTLSDEARRVAKVVFSQKNCTPATCTLCPPDSSNPPRAPGEVIFEAGYIREVIEVLHGLAKDAPYQHDHEEWILAAKRRFAEKLENLGDAAMSIQKYGEAIDHYSAALSLPPPDPKNLFIKRSKARVFKSLWDGALEDANEAIILDPLCHLPYEQKRVALHGAGNYGDAIEVQRMIRLLLSQSHDPHTRALLSEYVNPSDTEVMIRTVVRRIIRDLPRVLIDTTTGRLHDKFEQELAFERSSTCKELISSMATQISPPRIAHVVADFYRYVMLSHKWDDKEPLFQMVENKSIYELEPSLTNDKLKNFCRLVRDAGFKLAWSDTCCIDKKDLVVLQESLVAMFKWYRGSALTIVYLRGVRLPSTRGDLVKSVWNTRAWTFQEYVAAEVIQFYTEDWSLYLGLNSPNHKDSLEIISEMEEATGVSAADLLALRPGLDNIRQKLCLASTRQTTLVEDAAYSLFGIFSTSIPVIYGEGESALGRLLGHVLTASGDVSILAWTGESSSYNSCLPAQITFYNVLAVSHLPSFPADSIERIVARTSPEDLELATRLYDQLNGLSTPWFVANRMKLSCMIFPLQSIKSSRAGELHIYRATTTIFGVVEIRTTADLSQSNPLYLVHPWISSLLDRDFPDSKKPVEEDVRPGSPCPDEDANGAFGSNTAPVHSESTDWRLRGLKIVNRVVKPFVGWFSPAGLHRSLLPPSAVAPGIDKQRRAIRLIARLREPFGLLLLTPLRAGAMEYRRVAADSMITVRMQENTPLTYLLDSVRSIEVL